MDLAARFKQWLTTRAGVKPHADALAAEASTTVPERALLEGVASLREVMDPCGFVFRKGPSGASSGGLFASGNFERGNRVLELHFRHGLGLVTYRIGKASLDHESYLRFSGNWSAHRYPDFGSTPIESFQALAHDLSTFFTDFLRGDGREFLAVVAAHAADPDKFKGFSALGRK